MGRRSLREFGAEPLVLGRDGDRHPHATGTDWRGRSGRGVTTAPEGAGWRGSHGNIAAEWRVEPRSGDPQVSC